MAMIEHQVHLDAHFDVHLDIGELVLTGFPHINPDALLASFERELTRLVHRHGIPLATHADLSLDTITGLPPLPATTSARRLGAALAHSVHTGLTRRPQ
jgi:hypothetical protein